MSNQSKHTPGPLEAHQTTLLGAPCISLTTGKLFPTFICHVEGEDREANAKLFAAAPDLLEALSDLLALVPPEFNDGWNKEPGSKFNKGWQAARNAEAAIAKATA